MANTFTGVPRYIAAAPNLLTEETVRLLITTLETLVNRLMEDPTQCTQPWNRSDVFGEEYPLGGVW